MSTSPTYDDGLIAGFATCESLIVMMLEAVAIEEDGRANTARTTAEETYRAYQQVATESGEYPAKLWRQWKDNEAARNFHDHRATCLRETALAISQGQHRTNAYDPEELAQAHRRAGISPAMASAGGRARQAKLSPTERTKLAKMAVGKRWSKRSRLDNIMMTETMKREGE